MILIAYVWIALRLIRQQDGPRQPPDRLLPQHGENHPYKAPGEEPIRQRRHPRAAARSCEGPRMGGHLGGTEPATIHGLTSITRCFPICSGIGLTTGAIDLRLSADPLNLNPPIHVPKTNPDQGDLRDPPLTGSCSSSQDRTIPTNSYRRRSGGISTISPCPLRAPHRWIQA